MPIKSKKQKEIKRGLKVVIEGLTGTELMLASDLGPNSARFV